MRVAGADFLPGQITIERGTVRDYRRLEHFHYARGSPATWAGFWRATFSPWRAGAPSPIDVREGDDVASDGEVEAVDPKTRVSNCKSMTIAVAVLSYPAPSLRAREQALGLVGPRYGERLRFINAHVRTISRVIVHPQFRGLGVGAALVRRVCCDCTTRYVEALAAMGEVHPFFVRGGMTRVEGGYFLFDRGEQGQSAD